MFIGKYYHTLEAKGRISLPKNFRDQHEQWVITRGLDGGLFVFKETEFAHKLAEFEHRSLTAKHHRDFIRLMTNEAVSLTADANGRVQLPEYLTEFAQLKKDVVIVGSLSYIEIWDRDIYHDYIKTIEDNAEDIAESLTQTSI